MSGCCATRGGRRVSCTRHLTSTEGTHPRATSSSGCSSVRLMYSSAATTGPTATLEEPWSASHDGRPAPGAQGRSGSSTTRCSWPPLRRCGSCWRGSGPGRRPVRSVSLGHRKASRGWHRPQERQERTRALPTLLAPKKAQDVLAERVRRGRARSHLGPETLHRRSSTPPSLVPRVKSEGQTSLLALGWYAPTTQRRWAGCTRKFGRAHLGAPSPAADDRSITRWGCPWSGVVHERCPSSHHWNHCSRRRGSPGHRRWCRCEVRLTRATSGRSGALGQDAAQVERTGAGAGAGG